MLPTSVERLFRTPLDIVKFLADRSIPEPSVEEIRALGNTVAVAEGETADGRASLLDRSHREGQILLTFETEYYARIFEEGAPVPTGVVCFRIDWETPRDPANLLAAVLTDDDLSIDGQFTLLEEERMRQRPLDASN